MTEWGWYKKPKTAHLFIHLLLKANHSEKIWQGEVVKKGQLVTGRKALSVQTGLSEQEIRTGLTHLESTSEITIRATKKYSVITITKWDDYQHEQPATQPTTNQVPTTNKNEKNEKNKEIIDCVIDFLNQKTGKSFKKTTPSTRKVIGARIRDGFSLQDFKTVISTKTQKWANDPKMCDYLRPSTLFGNKFENYLQESDGEIDFSTVFHNPIREEKEFSWLPK